MKPFVIAALLAVLAIPALAANTDAPFDRPIHVRRIATGRSESDPRQQNELRCFTYAHFMIKEIDHREVADQQVSLLPVVAGAEPPCQTANRADERVFPPGRLGYAFLGVKQDYVFLSDGEVFNGGIAFAVYRGPSQAPVFEDTVLIQDTPRPFQAIEVNGDTLRLRYTRLQDSACSLFADGQPCWDRFAAAAGIPPGPAPDCGAAYRAARRAHATATCRQSAPGDPACIARSLSGLPAEVAGPSIARYEIWAEVRKTGHTMRPTGKPATCWPAS
jgi:hypothetical protein